VRATRGSGEIVRGGESSGRELARVGKQGRRVAARHGTLARGHQRGKVGPGDAREPRWQARGGAGGRWAGETHGGGGAETPVKLEVEDELEGFFCKYRKI
jgi:hypothetical protein